MHILTRLWRTFCHGRESSLQTPITASLDEMIFEGRNRAYGAYQLRKNYHWHLLVALGLVVSGPLTILLGFLWWQEFSHEPKTELVRTEVFICGGIPLPPPPPVQPRTIKCPTRTWHADLPRPIPPQPVGCTLLDEPLTPLPPSVPQEWILPELPDEIWPVVICDCEYEAGERVPEWLRLEEAETIEHAPTLPCESTVGEHPERWVAVESEPIPLNLTELIRTLEYPPILRDASVAGHVVVRILVDHQGHYLKHIVIASPHAAWWTKEIEKIVPRIRFEPAYGWGGEAVCFWVNIPFNVSLLPST